MKKTILFFLLLNPILLLSGCWNQRELNDLAIIMAIGIDKGENTRFDVSFQIVIPGNVIPGQNGGGQGLPIAVYKSSGNTLTEAVRKVTKKVSRQMYYAHTNLIIISEELAKDGILNIFDAFERDPTFRTTTQIVIAKDSSAVDIIKTLTMLDKLPAMKITKELQTTEAMLGENVNVNIDDFVAGIVSKGKHPFASGYKIMGKKSEISKASNLMTSTTEAYLKAGGLAIFNDGKLIGWVDDDNARGISWVLNKIKSTDINLDWKGKRNDLNVAILRSKTKVTVKTKNGIPVIKVVIKDESWISEINTAINVDDPAVIKQIDKKTEEKIKRKVMASIKEAQNLKCDVFGFGEKMHIANPQYWKKVEDNWDEQFAKAKVTVEVESYNRRTGLRRNSFWNALRK